MSMWASEAWSSAADMYLLTRSREGSAEAFGELWRRHLPAAYAVAGRYRGRTAAEDIVAEASARVFALIQDGKGPDEHFRAYFLSAVRSVAIDHSRRDLKVVPTEDETLEDIAEPVVPMVDPEFDAELIRTAFRGLSEKDQRVLWHTTVEGNAPRALAPILGMTPNAVSARAMRAREALRAGYLDACAARSLDGADSEECRWAIAHLGAHVRGRLPKRQNARVEEHLKHCDHAASVAADLRAIHSEFPALIVPFVFLAGLGTSGFVSAAAISGLSGGAAAAGAVAGTSAAAAGGTGSGVAVGASGAATAGAGSMASGAGSGAVPTAPPTSGVSDTVSQFAGRATTLVAGIAIGAGLASAAPIAAPLVAKPPVVVSTTPAPAPTPTPTPTQVPTPAPVPPPLRVIPPPRVTPPRLAPAPKATPAPKVTPRPAPAPPKPVVTPPPAPGLSPATASVRVVKGREATTFRLMVRGVDGPVTVVLSSPAGGSLSLRNGSWDCTSTGPASLTCTGEDGQGQFLQAGLDASAPIRVFITDSLGRTRTQVLALD